MLKTSLIAIGIATVTLIGMSDCGNGGPMGDTNPRPATKPVPDCTKDPAGNVDCSLQMGRN